MKTIIVAGYLGAAIAVAAGGQLQADELPEMALKFFQAPVSVTSFVPQELYGKDAGGVALAEPWTYRGYTTKVFPLFVDAGSQFGLDKRIVKI